MKYYLKKFIPVYQSRDLICVGYARSNRYLEIDDNDDNLKSLNKIIKEGISKDELSKPLYSHLFSFNFLEEQKKYVSAKEINRENLYLQYLENVNLNSSVKDTRILIFGAGAGGSTITYLLGQMGFSNLVLIDEDVVNQTDLGKSIVFDADDVGNSKVKAVSNHLQKNFGINIQYEEANFIDIQQVNHFFNKYDPDFVVKACDPDLIFRLNLNRVCFERGVPLIMMAYAFELLRLGPMYVPGYTSCDESFNRMVKAAYGEHYDFKSDKKLFTDYLVHPAISFNVNMMASFVLKEIVMFLTGQYEYCFTIGRLVEFNPLSLGYSSFEAICKNCDVCSSKIVEA